MLCNVANVVQHLRNALAGWLRLGGAKTKPVGVGLVPTQRQAQRRAAHRRQDASHNERTQNKIFFQKCKKKFAEMP
jgi:hypothetical protein